MRQALREIRPPPLTAGTTENDPAAFRFDPVDPCPRRLVSPSVLAANVPLHSLPLFAFRRKFTRASRKDSQQHNNGRSHTAIEHFQASVFLALCDKSECFVSRLSCAYIRTISCGRSGFALEALCTSFRICTDRATVRIACRF